MGRHVTLTQLRDLLEELDNFLDNYADMTDSEDNHMVPNRAMRLRLLVQEALEDLW